MPSPSASISSSSVILSYALTCASIRLCNATLALLPSRKKPGGDNPAIYPKPMIEATGSLMH